MSRLKNWVVLFFASILSSVAFNLFLLPNEVFNWWGNRSGYGVWNTHSYRCWNLVSDS